MASATVLLVSAYAHFFQTQINEIASSSVGAGGPQTGAMNILLMGLESRTFWNGTPIARGVEDIMHVGSVGGDTTNTLGVRQRDGLEAPATAGRRAGQGHEQGRTVLSGQ